MPPLESSASSPAIVEGWWTSFFDDEYADFGLRDTPPETLTKTVEFLVRTLALEPGMTVFDQCCGVGRLSLPLAERGMQIIGVEQSATYVESTQREADRRRLPCRFHRADAFEFVTPEPCDAAFNWFTSFGYSTDDAINIRMLHRVVESLKPGGRFALDYLNMPGIFADFQTRIFQKSTAPGADGLTVLYENTPDFLRGMLDSDWTLIRGDGRRSQRRVTTRMFMPHELARMCREAGLIDLTLFGSVDGSPLSRQSKRCIVTGRKPG